MDWRDRVRRTLRKAALFIRAELNYLKQNFVNRIIQPIRYSKNIIFCRTKQLVLPIAVQTKRKEFYKKMLKKNAQHR